MLASVGCPASPCRAHPGLGSGPGPSAGMAVGAGGFEVYGGVALLRSVVVSESARGKGVGSQLLNALLSWGRDNSVTNIYLLTESAVDFFAKYGFAEIGRDSVPSEVQASIEFKVCGSSATAMSLSL